MFNPFIDILEIFQISIILFILSLVGSFIVSLVFTEIDSAIENNSTIRDGEADLHDSKLYRFVKTIETFFQLFVTAVLYYAIDTFLHKIPSIVVIFRKREETYKTANYGIHIILIIILIEMNKSLKKGLEEIAEFITISN